MFSDEEIEHRLRNSTIVAIRGAFWFDQRTFQVGFRYDAESTASEHVAYSITIFAAGLNYHAPIELQRAAVQWMRVNHPELTKLLEPEWMVE